MKQAILATLLLATLNIANAGTLKGINYDANHSTAFLNARNGGDPTTMTNIINQDLAQIKAKGFTAIKTFYSVYCTDAPVCVDMAQMAQQNGLKIYLGVFEFPDHRDWSEAQREAAIRQANAYPDTVLGIVVGNENAFDYKGDPINAIDGNGNRVNLQVLLAEDMKKIRGDVSNRQIKVMTAQRQPDWNRLKESDPSGLIETSDVIAANFYPFWGNSPEKVDGKSVASKIPEQVAALSAKLGKPVIVGEEGWPSAGTNANTQDKNIQSSNDYYDTWKQRSDTFDSFYFSFYDKNPTVEKADDANTNFGLCTAGGTTKPGSDFTC